MKRFLGVFLLVLSVLVSGCATETWTNEPVKKVQDTSKVKKDAVVTDDLWYRIRQGFEIPDPNNELTDKHVRQLQANPVYVDRVLQRSSSYLFYIIEEVEARDMPSELALLPFVESAFNPKAVSPVKAAGMWQFMPATGKDFNLKQNIFRDERGDIIKSTRAALEYLQRLYDMFGDWQLALAAYNWGEGNVGRAVARNQANKLSTDFFSLSMPNETRNYVPKLLAYKRLIDDPKKYGFNLPKVENHPYFVKIPVERDIDVDKVVELSEITRDQFLALNPSFNKPVILKEFNQSILLPYGKAEVFQKNLSNHKNPLSNWTVAKVDKTETVDRIADELGTEADKIRDVNNIPRGMKIRSGSTILIPRTAEHNGNVPQELALNPTLNLEKEYVPPPFVPVPVVMKCRGKKCVAVPSNLTNYNPRNGASSAKATQVTEKSRPDKNGGKKSGTTVKQSSSKSSSSSRVSSSKSTSSGNTKVTSSKSSASSSTRSVTEKTTTSTSSSSHSSTNKSKDKK
jgi:membrane-bound lytic murein transglycosylase D